MPFSRKTLTQLRDAALQDVQAARIYDGTTGATVSPVVLEFDPLTISAKQMAGLAYEQYGYLDYISLQSTPATATDEAALTWGAAVKITPKAATPHTARRPSQALRARSFRRGPSCIGRTASATQHKLTRRSRSERFRSSSPIRLTSSVAPARWLSARR